MKEYGKNMFEFTLTLLCKSIRQVSTPTPPRHLDFFYLVPHFDMLSPILRCPRCLRSVQILYLTSFTCSVPEGSMSVCLLRHVTPYIPAHC